jgi:glycosyltransferase involved in cell wall biosynthesis
MPGSDPHLKSSPPDVFVSVVLPCYKSADVAVRSVHTLQNALNEHAWKWEIVVVDDGGGDFDEVGWQDNERIKLLRFSKNLGKGAAIRHGILSARGHIRIFTDVDLPFGADFAPAIASFLEAGFHMVIGDRTLPAACYHEHTSRSRRTASAFFTSFVGTLVTGGFFDTQCGLKGVRGDVADQLFPLLTIDRFAFDVEMIYVALKHRLDIKRIPVTLLNNETSSVRLVRDSLRGALDILRIKRNQLVGRYDSPALESIVQSDFESVKNAAYRSAWS